MAVEAKITLNRQQYVQELEQVKNKTKQATVNMSDSARKAGEDFSRVGGAVSALGGSIGQSFGAIGQSISALAAGSMGILIAAVAALASAVKQLYDNWTQSAEELAQAQKAEADGLKAQAKLIAAQVTNAEKYMKRLEELSKKESLSNTEKREAASLIARLTKRYGDLGISIDATTGKLTGLDAAQRKFIMKNAEMKEKQAQLELKASAGEASAAIENLRTAQRSGEFWGTSAIAEMYEFFGVESGSMERRSMEPLVDFIKNSENIDDAIKKVDFFLNRKEVQRDGALMTAFTNVRTKLYETKIKEMAFDEAKANKETAKSQVESMRQEEARQKRLAGLQKVSDESLKSLLQKGLITGEEYEAELKRRSGEQKKESELKTESAESAMLFTNALTQRGGFATGGRMETLTDINRRIANASAQTSKTLQQINAKMDNIDRVRL